MWEGWLLIAILTGGAWVFYFADAPTLARELFTFQAPIAAYGFIGLFAGTQFADGVHQFVEVAAEARAGDFADIEALRAEAYA